VPHRGQGRDGRPDPGRQILGQGLRRLGRQQLPSYARPVFVRIAKTLETTGTFKYRKVDLVADGFDPDKVDGADLCPRRQVRLPEADPDPRGSRS
jgi:hypothetical protein